MILSSLFLCIAIGFIFSVMSVMQPPNFRNSLLVLCAVDQSLYTASGLEGNTIELNKITSSPIENYTASIALPNPASIENNYKVEYICLVDTTFTLTKPDYANVKFKLGNQESTSNTGTATVTTGVTIELYKTYINGDYVWLITHLTGETVAFT
jgi:hypothetical protein